MNEIKNIIFDLGGVIINLDTAATIARFNTLSQKPFESVYTQLQQTALFDLFDKGIISEADFFSGIKKELGSEISHADMLVAWNAMLLDFPEHRLELLTQLGSRYRLFLLSNTNKTHVSEFEKQLFATRGHANLEPFFEKVYYSCRMQMRKPDKEIFEFVLTENKLKAAETLFIDDSPQHIEGALKTGIQAHVLPKGKEAEELLRELNLLSGY